MDATAVLSPAYARTPTLDGSPQRLLVPRSPASTQEDPEHLLLDDDALSFYGLRTPPPSHRGMRAPSLSTASSSTAASCEIKRESSDEQDHDQDARLRSDSSLTGGDARLSICSTSGTVYESVVVVGHVYGSDNVVYYLLEVKSWEMPLEGYVIRRRYNDFKELHSELALCMPLTGAVRRGSAPLAASSAVLAPLPRPPRSRSVPFGISTSSLLCTSLSTARPEASPLWSPKRPSGSAALNRRNSITGMRLHGLDESGEPCSTEDPHLDYDKRFSVPSIAVPSPAKWSGGYGQVDLPFHEVSFDRDGRPLLPSMPPGGVSSFFSTRDMLIKYRIAKFNRILAAVLSDTSPRVAQLLQTFIQDKPSAPQTYVSLNQYAPVEMPWSVERHARRRATMSGKREKALQSTLSTTS